MINFYETVSCCRFCGGSLRPLLDLGSQPLANATYLKTETRPDNIPLSLLFCEKCALPQLGQNVNPDVLFQNYLWKSGTGAATLNYAKSLPGLLKAEIGVFDSILEVACNDGTFLKEFAHLGKLAVGVDPAVNITSQLADEDFEVFTNFLNVISAKSITAKHGVFDVVLARNVVPHVSDLVQLIEGVIHLISDKGHFVIEFHSAERIANEIQYDSIYHEHVFYFSLLSLTRVLDKFGFKLHTCFDSPLSGGSVVGCFIKTNDKIALTPAAKKQLDLEESLELHSFGRWKTFAEQVLEHSQKLTSLVRSFNGSKIFAFGASARSSTLMNFCNIDSKLIDFIIDNNELKQNRITPGTDIPIISLLNAAPSLSNYSVCFLSAWNFKDEIIRTLMYHGFSGQIILPFPSPKIVDTNDYGTKFN
jgi:SAM-dependent methyltransferase